MRRALLLAMMLALTACSNGPDGGDPADEASGDARSPAGVAAPSISPAPPDFTPRAQGPVLAVQETLDFGKARTGKKMLPLPVRNDGGETLTFQISSDREYITMRGARGSVPSGATATVLVTYDYDRALDGARDVPLPVTSNAGRDTVRVLGLTDSIGPHVGDNDMKTLHRHCSGGTCSDFRHARADITDASSAVVSAKLHYRVCRGAGSAAPACGEWRLQEMPHISGTLYQADAGPLPACAPQLTVVVHYRVIARDDLGNESYTPGNSTWFFGPHCRP